MHHECDYYSDPHTVRSDSSDELRGAEMTSIVSGCLRYRVAVTCMTKVGVFTTLTLKRARFRPNRDGLFRDVL